MRLCFVFNGLFGVARKSGIIFCALLLIEGEKMGPIPTIPIYTYTFYVVGRGNTPTTLVKNTALPMRINLDLAIRM